MRRNLAASDAETLAIGELLESGGREAFEALPLSCAQGDQDADDRAGEPRGPARVVVDRRDRGEAVEAFARERSRGPSPRAPGDRPTRASCA